MSRPRACALSPESAMWLVADIGIPVGRDFIALLEAFRATGGTAPCEIVGGMLEAHHAGNALSLARCIYTGEALGFAWGASLWVPMFQFDTDDMALKVDAQRVRAVLPAAWSAWSVASWFAGSNTRLGGRSPANLLESDLDDVFLAARSQQSVAEATPSNARRSHEMAAHA